MKKKDFETLYYDLLDCVAKKYPNETRHETAKRILLQHENQSSQTGSCNCSKELKTEEI